MERTISEWQQTDNPINTGVYQTNDKCRALASAITRKYGLEVPLCFVFPEYVFVPDDLRDVPAYLRGRDSWYTYYRKGGYAFPDRWIVWWERT